MAAFLFALWMMRWHSSRSRDKTHEKNLFKHAKIVVLILALSLYMTQARGPWIGTVVALAVASIGRAKRPLRRAILLLALGLAVGIPAYQIGKEYLSGPRTDYGSEKETAQYRAELIDNYIPLAESGGGWGLGRMVPVVHGQTSIDNEYLFLWLVQGYVGLISFLIVLVVTIVTFFRYGLANKNPPDRQLSFAIVGILLGLAFTISTVWLGAQSFELLFLIVGWSQVLEQRTAVRYAQEQLKEIYAYT